MMGHSLGLTLHHQESPEAPGARMQRGTFHQGHKEPLAPSPPRAVASLSVRVLGQPARQGLPPALPRAQEKEGTAPSEPGSAHPVLHLSRSAGGAAGSHVQEDSDEGDDGDDESDDDEDWGPGPGGVRTGNRAPALPQQLPPSVPRSKRKLQPPQHIPPPQVHHTPMQLRHPTPPPSPPPNLFSLPDTPKQSPPDLDQQEREGRGPRGGAFPPTGMQRQDSDSSSRSSSPEPPVKRRPGPLSLLVHKMESEGAFCGADGTSAAGMSGATATPSSTVAPPQRLEAKKQQENREMEQERQLKEEKEKERQQELERERRKTLELEREKRRLEEEQEKQRKQLEEEKRRKKVEHEMEKESLNEKKRREERQLKEEQEKKQETTSQGRVVVTEAQVSGSSSDSDSSSQSSQTSSSPARPLKVSDRT